MRMEYQVTNMTAHPFENKHVKKTIDRVIRKLAGERKVRICDPFSNNKTERRQGTTLVSNDLNPKFNANFCMEANDFGQYMEDNHYEFDLVLFDPPYSLRQLKEQYENIGSKLELWQTHNMWGRCKNHLAKCIVPGGYFISFGWSSSGMGRKRGFEKQEILLLCQAGHEDRYDTIVTVEKKIDTDLFTYQSEF